MSVNVLLDEDCRPLVEGKRLTRHSNGYIRVGHKYLHRLVLGAKKGQIVDHINGNPLDNRRANLRLATRSQNLFNRGRPKHNTSGFKGVHFCKRTKRYRASIRANNRVVRLGRFDTAAKAARAYDKAARVHHGDFAQLNFPRGCP